MSYWFSTVIMCLTSGDTAGVCAAKRHYLNLEEEEQNPLFWKHCKIRNHAKMRELRRSMQTFLFFILVDETILGIQGVLSLPRLIIPAAGKDYAFC